ncbi:MAG: nuclear transport factor 2 family protein [Hyphomicrobiales bacterium]|nr:nuclear transport factor 2 family protein [Hyphomicrobiales bacterium]
MSESETRETLAALLQAHRRRDFTGFAVLLHDDIDWIIHGPIEVFPFAGLRRGRPAVLQALALMGLSYSLHDYEPDFTIVEDDRAAIMADVSLTQLATGRLLRFRAANLIRVAGGKVIEFREFADSFDQAEQALGRLIEL